MRPRDPFADPEQLIRRVYAYIAYRIGDGPDAEDVTNETIERALRYRDSYDHAKGDAVGWAIGIARRVLASTYARPQDVSLDDRLEAPDDVENAAVRRLALHAAVGRLGERDRELIALRYGADLSAREIAALLDLKVNAAEVALHRALGRLRAELERDTTVGSAPVIQVAAD